MDHKRKSLDTVNRHEMADSVHSLNGGFFFTINRLRINWRQAKKSSFHDSLNYQYKRIQKFLAQL